jgi:hypothetical protein
MIKIIFIIILVQSVFLFANVLADDEIETDETPVEKEQNSELSDDKKLEEFVPSEEISIDKPVAFPVDI